MAAKKLSDQEANDSILKHMNYIQEQFAVTSKFAVYNYIKTSKVNHNLVMAMRNVGYLESIGRGEYRMLKVDPFKENNALAVIRELNRLSKIYADTSTERARQKRIEAKNLKEKISQEYASIVKEEPVEVVKAIEEKENAPVKGIMVNDEIAFQYFKYTSQMFESQIEELKEKVASLTDAIEVKDGYIAHLHEQNIKLLRNGK